MKIVIGCDHAGYAAKHELIPLLKELGHEVVDVGTDGEESCDYADFARKTVQAVRDGACERGILLCGTGIGMSIAANRATGIHAALCHNILTVRFSRQHNDADILCMGARILGIELMKAMVQEFLDTAFAGGRHARRLAKIENQVS